MTQHLTVVYTIHDQEAFQAEHYRLKQKFMESEGKPWAITAMSLDHEMQRLHWVEEALHQDDKEAALAALSHPNITEVECLTELQG